jgi:hypothetical protein
VLTSGNSGHFNGARSVERLSPKLIVKKRAMIPRRCYLVEIALGMPASETNAHPGMLSVSVELESSNGASPASSIRSARLPHKTPWVGNIRKFVRLPGLLLGALTEILTIVIPAFRHLFFRHYIESPDNSLVRL